MMAPSPDLAIPRSSGLKRAVELAFFTGEYAVMRTVSRGGPGPIYRRIFQVGIWLYKIRLGSLVSQQVLLLTTIGRKSGRPRVTPLGYGYDTSSDTYFLTSGWEGRTNWFRNVGANPKVHVEVGSLQFDGVAKVLSKTDAMRILNEYTRRNPFAARTWGRWSEAPFDGSEAALARAAAHFPVVAVQPA